MSYTVVQGGQILQFADQEITWEKWDLHCGQGRIIFLGPQNVAPPPPNDAIFLDTQGCFVLPGLINAHGHAAMTLFRGLADDLDLNTWLTKHMFVAERHLTPEAVYWGAMLACVEMIKSGTTCFADMYLFAPSVAKAAQEAGLRAVSGEALFGFESLGYGNLDQGFALVKDFAAAFQNDERVRTSVHIHSIYTCSDSVIEKAISLARQLNLSVHIHLSETQKEVRDCLEQNGCRPVEHLYKLGALYDQVWAAHGVWLTEAEMRILTNCGVGIAHCPVSNMKLTSGRLDLVNLLKYGIALGLGTDGCASNNRLDMFAEMDMFAKLHKLGSMDPAVAPAALALNMATKMGAQVIKWPELGELYLNGPADFIVVDFNQPHLTPVYNPVSHLVYAARGADVRHTVCNGEILMRDRRLTRLNEQEIMAKVKEQALLVTGKALFK